MSNSYDIRLTENKENFIITSAKEAILLEVASPSKSQILIESSSKGPKEEEDLTIELNNYESILSNQEQQLKDMDNFFDNLGSQPTKIEQLVAGSLTEFSSNEITTVKPYTFRQSSNLQKVLLPNVVKIGSQAFQHCPKLTTLDFPRLTTLEAYALQDCSGLTDVNLPMLTYPQTSSFVNCVGLTRLELPATDQIGNLTFSGCTNLNALVLRKNNVCKLNNIAAFNNTPIATGVGFIYVPDDLVSAYKTATNWVVYASKIKGLSELDKIGYLPDAYQKVEYIESTGTQYIKTDIIGDSDCGVELQTYVTGGTNNSCGVGSWGEDSGTTRAWLFYLFGGTFRCGYGNTNVALDKPVEVNTWYKWRVEVANKQQLIYVDDEKIYTSAAKDPFTTGYELFLFGMNNKGVFNYEFKGRMAYVKLYKSNILVSSFIPCYRKTDNAIGMYDLIGNKFYTNAGTGTFLKGPDVKEENK